MIAYENDKVMPLFLEGKSFAVTGKLEEFENRGCVEGYIKEYGGIFHKIVKKDTDFLVTNTPDSGSSKNKKAQAYGTCIISEKELIRMTNNGESWLRKA